MSARTTELGAYKRVFQGRVKYLEEAADRMRRSPIADKEKQQAIAKILLEREALAWALSMIDITVKLRTRED